MQTKRKLFTANDRHSDTNRGLFAMSGLQTQNGEERNKSEESADRFRYNREANKAQPNNHWLLIASQWDLLLTRYPYNNEVLSQISSDILSASHFI